jgi:hypothetical protein
VAGLESGVNNSAVSKPFLVAAVVFVFVGTAIGSVWMMALFGTRLPVDSAPFSLHRVLQIDGFLTIVIMGIGYMIVPRFRNASLPSTRLAYASFALAMASVTIAIISAVTTDRALATAADASMLAGVSIFAATVLLMVKTRPKLLRLADYFIALSAITLVSINVLHATGLALANPLAEIQMWLLFPTLMIFGVEYKTMPSFLGFIRPRKRPAQASLALAVASVAFGIAAIIQDTPLLSLAFNAALLSSAGLFALSLYIFGGFDNGEILRLISGEKKARYVYTTAYARLAFAFLFLAAVFAILFNALDNPAFLFYDLAIHYTAIGFVGTTIALYLPLMLPPILGKQVQFARFSHAPVLLLVAALFIRAMGDLYIGMPAGPASYVMMSSGWIVVAALFVFVFMLHRSMGSQIQEPKR